MPKQNKERITDIFKCHKKHYNMKHIINILLNKMFNNVNDTFIVLLSEYVNICKANKDALDAEYKLYKNTYDKWINYSDELYLDISYDMYENILKFIDCIQKECTKGYNDLVNFINKYALNDNHKRKLLKLLNESVEEYIDLIVIL